MEKKSLPQPLIKLKQIISKGLQETAVLFTPIKSADKLVYKAVDILDKNAWYRINHAQTQLGLMYSVYLILDIFTLVFCGYLSIITRLRTFKGDQKIKLSEWLKQFGVENMAMESTGVYWIPVFQILESCSFDIKLDLVSF